MNIQAMMAQARKMQKDIEKTNKEIEESTFSYENNNILVESNGKYEITKIKIKNNDILEDSEMLEDVILVAINNVIDKINKMKEEKLGKYTSGLGGLF